MTQRRRLAWVKLGQMDRVDVTQGQGGDKGRSGIGIRPEPRPHLGQTAAIGVVGWKSPFDPRDPRRRLAGFHRLVRGQVVKRPPRMGFDIGQRLVLAGQIIQRDRQKRVLLNVCQISGVIDVLVGQHWAALAVPRRGGQVRSGPGKPGQAVGNGRVEQMSHHFLATLARLANRYHAHQNGIVDQHFYTAAINTLNPAQPIA